MKSPTGSLISSYLYDRYPGLPPPGSHLETVFLLVHRERQRTDVLSVKAHVQSLILILQQLGASAAVSKPALAAFEAYTAQVLPVEKQTDGMSEEHRKLHDFVKHPARIDPHALLTQRIETAKAKVGRATRRLRPQKAR